MMKDYIKCDICGKCFDVDENERYDGLMPYFYTDDGETVVPVDNRSKSIIDSDGCSIGVPEMIDMCSGCFEKFTDWIKAQKGVDQND